MTQTGYKPLASTLTHIQLAQFWCKWNGQRGTDKQCVAVMKQLRIEDLTRMLHERGVVDI